MDPNLAWAFVAKFFFFFLLVWIDAKRIESVTIKGIVSGDRAELIIGQEQWPFNKLGNISDVTFPPWTKKI